MPIPFIISVILKAITGWMRFRLMLVRRFQEFMSELGMGLFIAYGDNDTQQILNLCKYLEATIKAYVMVISPPCILSSFMREIEQSPELKWFFEGYTGYQNWKTFLEEYNYNPPWNAVSSPWAEKYPGAYALPPPNMSTQEISLQPWKIQEWLWTELSAKINVDKWTPQQVVDWINQNLNTNIPQPEYAYAPYGFWLLVHPWLPLDWGVIKAYIIMLKTYLTLAGSARLGEIVQPYVIHQRVHVYANDVLAGVQYLGPDGSLQISIPKIPGINTITLDTYGLKTTIPLAMPWAPSIKRPSEIYLLNVNDLTKVKEMAQDYDCVIIDAFLPNVDPEDLSDLLYAKEIKLMVRKDTESAIKLQCPALLNILYTKETPICNLYDANVLTDEQMKQHFGTTSISALWDYFTYNGDKVQQAQPYATSTRDYNASWSWVAHGKSIVMECPSDGIWKDLDTLDKWMTWIYARRVLVISHYDTDTPGWHQYPTLDQTLQAYAQQFNITVHDLRS